MVAGRDQPGERLLANLAFHHGGQATERTLSDKAHEVLAFLRLDHLTDEMAGNLSGGQRKLLSLGRVLMMEPRLILLDEPAAGVNETLAPELFDHIQVLNTQGDRKSVGEGQRWSDRVDLGGCRILKKKTN